ncbi:MAG: beta strand repeat-containing protein, partial [Pirellulales bacterium]
RFDTTNTYTGVTTINGGTLALNSGAAIANTGVVALADTAGATLQVLVSETIGTLSGGGVAGGAVVIPVGQTLALASGTQSFAGTVSGAGTLVNSGAAQTITGVVSVSGGVAAISGRLNLGGANTYAGETLVSPGAAVVATANGALSGTGAGNGTVLSGAGGAVSGVLGFAAVDYTTAEPVAGMGLGNTATVSGLGAVQRGFVQGVSGSSRFAGDITISGSGISRIGVQNGAILNLTGSITPAAGVTGVTMLFRAGDTNGDFVILSGTDNAWDTDTAIYTGNNTAGQYAGVRLGASNGLPTNVGVYGNSSTQLATTLDLNGFGQKLNGLTSTGQPTGIPAQLRITNLAAGGTSTLTLDVTATRSTSLTTLQEVPGGGVLALSKTGTGLQVLGGTNTYSGPTTVAAGTLRFTRPVSLYGGTTAHWTPSRITVDAGATLAVAVGVTASEFTADDVATLAANLTTGVNNNGLRAGSFLGLNAVSPTTISASLTDSTGIGGGALGVVKTGASSITLDGANTYSGPTFVDEGQLTVNGELGATSVSIAAGATLAGSGTIAGGGTVDGYLTPGSSVGVITLGSLVLGGTTAFDIGTGVIRGTDYDGVTITSSGALQYGGALTLSFSGVVGDNTTYDLFSFSGVSTGSFVSVTSSGAYPGTWTNIGSGSWQLTSGPQVATFSQVTGDLFIVPEPTTCVTALGTAGLVLRLIQRRRDA